MRRCALTLHRPPSAEFSIGFIRLRMTHPHTVGLCTNDWTLCCVMSGQERPKSANPNRRLRTAKHHQLVMASVGGTLSRVDMNPEEIAEEEQVLEPAVRTDSRIDDSEDKSVRVASAAFSRRLAASQIPPPPPTQACDSMLTFECVQKASALRVLAKTWDRQRDVAATRISDASASASADRVGSVANLKGAPPPRKLRPLSREFSGHY